MYLLIIVAIIVCIFRLPIVKGIIGEAIVRIIIGKNSIDSKAPKFVINNLVLESANGRTSQIDHVVINQNGVFVIETKNYSGRIYGNDSQINWTQVLNYGRVKNHFYNPIKQNYTHICVIQELLKQKVEIFSVVVFVKGNIRYINSENVYNVFGLMKKLKTNSKICISIEQMNLIYDTLIEHNKNMVVSNSEHIACVERMKNDVKNGICPRCGSILVVRHGKNGDFMGCSKYPRCRFTKSID
ncbi:nuclease-related domain (NERD) protein [Ruminococcus sp. CAG:382]|nr:nuclease-related domain (NERD) protein [Ruminococcus sp. CAG:382]